MMSVHRSVINSATHVSKVVCHEARSEWREKSRSLTKWAETYADCAGATGYTLSLRVWMYSWQYPVATLSAFRSLIVILPPRRFDHFS